MDVTKNEDPHSIGRQISSDSPFLDSSRQRAALVFAGWSGGPPSRR